VCPAGPVGACNNCAELRSGLAAGFLLYGSAVRPLLLLLIASAGCSGYQAGSFKGLQGTFGGERRTVGCLDVAIAAETDTDAVGPVAGITVANRCDVAVKVDINAIIATGREPNGDVIALAPYDPAWEIHAATLEARAVAQEYIEYQAPQDAELSFSEWCLDLRNLDVKRPTDLPVMVCFANGVEI